SGPLRSRLSSGVIWISLLSSPPLLLCDISAISYSEVRDSSLFFLRARSPQTAPMLSTGILNDCPKDFRVRWTRQREQDRENVPSEGAKHPEESESYCRERGLIYVKNSPRGPKLGLWSSRSNMGGRV
ncbi:hypothetical protein PIB30_048128, partial [Stylosanthes scabra]|nr:hypothetical protein [Stylosanthes scabra]